MRNRNNSAWSWDCVETGRSASTIIIDSKVVNRLERGRNVGQCGGDDANQSVVRSCTTDCCLLGGMLRIVAVSQPGLYSGRRKAALHT
jgi:hypothetical protein